MAVSNPVDIPGWLQAMSPAQKEGLTTHDLSQTQANYGAEVYVLAHREHWSEVVVPGQPTPKNALGYPGWVPDDHLCRNPEYGMSQDRLPFALVDAGVSAWLYDDPGLRHKNLLLSVNTRLPLLDRTDQALLVDTPDQGAKWLERSSASVYRNNSDIAMPTGRDLVRTAETFLGRPYLWAGRSGFGVDCSGLISTVYELHSITIPRDACPQALDGGATRVADDNLRAGDLMFYAHPGTEDIYHVAMYVGGGKMIEAYDHLTPVRVTPVRFNSDYWGGVRYLTAGRRATSSS
jgi:cell wall-associated NlpC family hydrolase